MATYKVIHQPGKFRDEGCYQAVIDYLRKPHKISEGGIIGSSVVPCIAPTAMKVVTEAYHKEDGLKLRHSVLSFAEEDHITLKQVRKIAREAMEYYADDYQILAAVHEDRDHLHIHFVMNTTSYVDGSKYHGTKADYYGYLKHLNQVVRPYGIEVKPVT